MSLRAYIYGRVASPLKADGGGEQIAECRAYGALHQMRIVGHAVDLGISGLRTTGLGMAAVVKAMTDGRIDAVLVRDAAGISRSRAEVMGFLALAEQTGVAEITPEHGVLTPFKATVQVVLAMPRPRPRKLQASKG